MYLYKVKCTATKCKLGFVCREAKRLENADLHGKNILII